MFDVIEYEPPEIMLLRKGNGEGHYHRGYGHWHCNGFNEYIGHGDGYYRWLNYKEFKNNFNLIYKL